MASVGDPKTTAMAKQSIHSLRFPLVTCCLQSWACGNKAIGAEGPELWSDEVSVCWASISLEVVVAISLDLGVGDGASKHVWNISPHHPFAHFNPSGWVRHIASPPKVHRWSNLIHKSHKGSFWLGTLNLKGLINSFQKPFHEHLDIFIQISISILDHLSHHHQKSNFHSALQLGHCHSTRPLSAAVLPSESSAVERPRRSSPVHVLGWRTTGRELRRN